jgi:hypothetical protein
LRSHDKEWGKWYVSNFLLDHIDPALLIRPMISGIFGITTLGLRLWYP